MFSKVIEYFEQNIGKQMDYKRPLTTKQINREHVEIQIEALNYANQHKTRQGYYLQFLFKLTLNHIK